MCAPGCMFQSLIFWSHPWMQCINTPIHVCNSTWFPTSVLSPMHSCMQTCVPGCVPMCMSQSHLLSIAKWYLRSEVRSSTAKCPLRLEVRSEVKSSDIQIRGETSKWRCQPSSTTETSNWKVTHLIRGETSIGGETFNQRWDLRSEFPQPGGILFRAVCGDQHTWLHQE